jgi:predicted MFS family arabinose efflux permease
VASPTQERESDGPRITVTLRQLMQRDRFGSAFPRLFAAAILQEFSFALLIHFPGYLAGLGATEGLIGILYSASAIVSLIFRPWLGRILDLTHRRTVLLVSGFLNVSVVLLMITTSVWGPYLWILFLAQRTFQVALFTTALTYGADTIPMGVRTQGLAIFGLSGLIPIAFAGYLGDVVIAAGGYPALFWTAGIAGSVSWLLVWTLPTFPVRGRQPRRSFWKAFGQRNLLPLWFSSLLLFVGFESLFTFTRTYVDDRQVGSAGLFFAIYGASAVITRILGGSRYDTLPHRTVLVLAISFFGVGLVGMAFAQSAVTLGVAAFVMGTAHGTAFPLLSSEVVNRARVAERGSAMAIFTAIFDIALLVGAPTIGFLIDGFGYAVAFTTGGVALVVGSLIYGVWDKRLIASSTPVVAEEAL